MFTSMQDAWNKPFVECFNTVSPVPMLDMPNSPTVAELVVHHAGAPPLNHIIIAPDGTPIVSEDDFPAVVRQLTKDTYNESLARCHYSNGNIILIGLLIRPFPECRSLKPSINSCLKN